MGVFLSMVYLLGLCFFLKLFEIFLTALVKKYLEGETFIKLTKSLFFFCDKYFFLNQKLQNLLAKHFQVLQAFNIK